MRDGIICLEAEQYQPYFKIIREPQFFFAKFQKKYVRNICVYVVSIFVVFFFLTFQDGDFASLFDIMQAIECEKRQNYL